MKEHCMIFPHVGDDSYPLTDLVKQWFNGSNCYSFISNLFI